MFRVKFERTHKVNEDNERMSFDMRCKMGMHHYVNSSDKANWACWRCTRCNKINHVLGSAPN